MTLTLAQLLGVAPITLAAPALPNTSRTYTYVDWEE